jgi:coproporphyrinogen III oxidase
MIKDFVWTKTNGRIESILMSLPKCTMGYDHHPEVGSEEKLVKVLEINDWNLD